MADVLRFESLDLPPAYLRLPAKVDRWDRLNYYLIHGQRNDGPVENVRYWGQWRVLAIGSNSLEPSTRYIRPFNIDNDELDFADFAPWEEMGGVFSLAETELQALTAYSETLTCQGAGRRGALVHRWRHPSYQPGRACPDGGRIRASAPLQTASKYGYPYSQPWGFLWPPAI
jgi:hypothetical protein